MNNSNNRVAKLAGILQAEKGWWIALSGGVDSGVLLAEAKSAVGTDKIRAVTGISAAVPETDRVAASNLCTQLGVSHQFVETRELSQDAYRRNDASRCFHCRIELFEVMKAVVALDAPLGFRIAYGAITDDLRDDRPGMRAAEKLGVSAPLLEAGIGKGDVRALAQKWDLSVKDKPAGACLASRIERGLEVTHERLAQVERAEIGLAALGFRQFRVRYHGSVARIELDEAGLRRIQTSGIREEAIRVTREAGFRFVSVDLQEFRSGSLNPADSQ